MTRDIEIEIRIDDRDNRWNRRLSSDEVCREIPVGLNGVYPVAELVQMGFAAEIFV